MGDWSSPDVTQLIGRDWVSATQEVATNQTLVSTAWPAANRALFMPVRLPVDCTVYKFVVGCGATGGGNFDVGLYDQSGNRLISSGSTAQLAASDVICDVTDTFLGAGVYYLALAVDGTTNMPMLTPSGTSPVPLNKAKLLGLLEMDTAFTLPSTATFAPASAALLPAMAAYLRSN